MTIAVTELTTSTVNGTGIFDLLMQANKAHLDAEFVKNRIKGPEYSTVYLGSLDSVMRTSIEFLIQRQRVDLEAQLLTQQIELAKIELIKAGVAVRLAEQEILNSQVQMQVLLATKDKIAGDILDTAAKTLLTQQQTLQTVQETANAVIQGRVLVAQECKLKAEYDLTVSSTIKSGTENQLLAQKVVTEKAQTTSLAVDDNSVIGKQKKLYQAQTDGFARDAEQKAAKMWLDTWNARRMTDEGTQANNTNMLDDVTIGRLMTKVLTGIQA